MNIDIETLHVSTVDVKPIDIDWNPDHGGEYVDEEDRPQWWQVIDYERDDDTFELVTQNGQVVAIALDNCNYKFNDWAWYVDNYTSEETGELEDSAPLQGKDEFDALFEVEPYQWGGEGPMMNYWYPIEEDAGEYSRFDPVWAAVKITDEPLCVVLVDDKYGLALTGGGMDLSWNVCRAFMKVGKLPPAHFSDLPAFAEEWSETKDLVVAGMRRSLEWMRDQMTYRLERLESLKERSTR